MLAVTFNEFACAEQEYPLEEEDACFPTRETTWRFLLPFIPVLVVVVSNPTRQPKQHRIRFPLAKRFRIISFTYVCMTLAYVFFIVPRYVPFMTAFMGENDGREANLKEIFDGWWLVVFVRFLLFAGNISAIVMCFLVMRKLVRCIEPDIMQN